VAVSLANLLGDYRRAELAKYEDEYVPLISPASLATRSDRWFVGLDDFHFGRPTRFAGEVATARAKLPAIRGYAGQ
jgi:hypothetical protein